MTRSCRRLPIASRLLVSAVVVAVAVAPNVGAGAATKGDVRQATAKVRRLLRDVHQARAQLAHLQQALATKTAQVDDAAGQAGSDQRPTALHAGTGSGGGGAVPADGGRSQRPRRRGVHRGTGAELRLPRGIVIVRPAVRPDGIHQRPRTERRGPRGVGRQHQERAPGPTAAADESAGPAAGDARPSGGGAFGRGRQPVPTADVVASHRYRPLAGGGPEEACVEVVSGGAAGRGEPGLRRIPSRRAAPAGLRARLRGLSGGRAPRVHGLLRRTSLRRRLPPAPGQRHRGARGRADLRGVRRVRDEGVQRARRQRRRDLGALRHRVQRAPVCLRTRLERAGACRRGRGLHRHDRATRSAYPTTISSSIRTSCRRRGLRAPTGTRSSRTPSTPTRSWSTSAAER